MGTRFSFALAACAALGPLACVSSSTPQGASGEDAGAAFDAGGSGFDAGIDATLPDAGSDAAPPGDAGPTDAAPPEDSSLVCSDSGTGQCLYVLATNQGNPEAVVVYDGYLYWVEEGAAGRIQRMPLGGVGPVEQLVANQDTTYELAIEDGGMYWAQGFGSAGVYTAPVTGLPDGQAPVRLANVDGGSVADLAIDSTRVYWTDFNAGIVYAAPIGGISDGGSPTVMAAGQVEPWAVASDGTNLYFTDNTVDGSVLSLPVSTVNGAAPAVLARADQPNRIQVIGGNLYFSTASANAVYSIPATGIDGGSAPAVVLASGGTTASFAFDGTTFFWTTSAGAVLAATPGATATTLATGMTSPVGITYDGTHVYWANAAFGAVFMMAK